MFLGELSTNQDQIVLFILYSKQQGYTDQQIREKLSINLGTLSDVEWDNYLSLANARIPKVTIQIPENFQSLTAGQKAFLYLSLLFDAKLRDSQIRTAVEAKLGPQSDDSWSALQKLAFGDFTGDRATISGFIRYNVMKGTPLSELRQQIANEYRRNITDAEWSQFVALYISTVPFVFGGKGAIASVAAEGGTAAGGGGGIGLLIAAAAAYFLLG